jgi:hypothetical protein
LTIRENQRNSRQKIFSCEQVAIPPETGEPKIKKFPLSDGQRELLIMEGYGVLVGVGVPVAVGVAEGAAVVLVGVADGGVVPVGVGVALGAGDDDAL